MTEIKCSSCGSEHLAMIQSVDLEYYWIDGEWCYQGTIDSGDKPEYFCLDCSRELYESDFQEEDLTTEDSPEEARRIITEYLKSESKEK